MNMDDPELEQIRAARLAQMQAQAGGNDASANAQKERMQQMEDAKNAILARGLTQDARARLNMLKLSKPEKGAMVENFVIQLLQTGQLPPPVSEEKLKNILESLNQQMPRSNSTVKFDRRRAALDSDDDDI